MTNPYLEDEVDEPAVTAEMPPITKQRVEVKNAELVVSAEKPGTVSFGDKVKKYYKGLIVVVGSILALVNQVTPLTDFLGTDVQHGVTIAILMFTSLLTFLKSNEQWVNAL